MKRVSLIWWMLPVLLLGWWSNVDARGARPVLSKQDAAVATLVGEYKWGLNPNQVVGLLTQRLKSQFVNKIRKQRGMPTKQDALRRQLAALIKKVKSSLVTFNGGQTNWDSSIVDDQFKHKNGESLLVYLEKEQQRFFFFHKNKLYKQFIAFNADHPNYKGLNFPQFLGKLIQIFGAGRPVFQKDLSGSSRLHHVEWTGGNGIDMWALDKSTIYGNFCLVVTNRPMFTVVKAGRKNVAAAAPGRPAIDPALRNILKPQPKDQF